MFIALYATQQRPWKTGLRDKYSGVPELPCALLMNSQQHTDTLRSLYTTCCTHKHRAIKTGWIVLDALDQAWIPHYCHWRLNERFYGDMVGKDPAAATAAFGADRVALWRDSYTVPPVPMPRSSSRHPWNQKRYK
jgi:bisphosphoglycerate-dependent phosphoglycerate mutase family 1